MDTKQISMQCHRSQCTPRSNATCARYGDLENLLALSIRHSELRTLIRVLAGGGEEGRASLLRLCSTFQAAAEGRGSGVPEGDQESSTDALLQSLPAWEIYQFLVRSFLSLHMLGDAGFFPPSLPDTPPPPKPPHLLYF